MCVTTMPELGMSPVGLNDVYGTPRNPWHLRHCCGGSSSGAALCIHASSPPHAYRCHLPDSRSHSTPARIQPHSDIARPCHLHGSPVWWQQLWCGLSQAGIRSAGRSGSAAVVSSGLMPVALASDAGGSVRVPAAHCGVVGLLPSVCRVPRQTVVSISSVVVTGVIAGTVADCTLVYSVIARTGGSDVPEGDRAASPLFGDLGPSLVPLRLPKFAGPGGSLSGVRIGVYRSWFDDCDPEVQASAQAGLDFMHAMGAPLLCSALWRVQCGAVCVLPKRTACAALALHCAWCFNANDKTRLFDHIQLYQALLMPQAGSTSGTSSSCSCFYAMFAVEAI